MNNDILTLLIVLTAVFSYLNYKLIRLPATIGIMFISLLCSLLLVIIGQFHPPFLQKPILLVQSVDFESALMKIMLSFLLFAGAIHIDVVHLKKEAIPIAAFSVLGVIISTVIVGVLMFLVFNLFHYDLPIIICLLFGALISPTDPIAVLGILKEAKIPPSLEIKVTGESLFNDGVGVVVFISILEVATTGIENLSIGQVIWLFIRETGGGIIWGLILGYSGFILLSSINRYQVEVLITIAIVMGGYYLANVLHISGLLAMVVAGIIIGNKVKSEAMSDISRDYLDKFWELVDEILNAILFMMIGFEVLVLSFRPPLIWIGLIAIPVVLFARFISVLIPSYILSFRRSFEPNMIPVLTWGGLRGGISVALALSLPYIMHRNELVAITYIIVVFSILVQGLTIGKLVKSGVRTND